MISPDCAAGITFALAVLLVALLLDRRWVKRKAFQEGWEARGHEVLAHTVRERRTK